MFKQKKLKNIVTLSFLVLGLLPLLILGSYIVLILNKHLTNDIQKENIVLVKSIANQTEDFLTTPRLVLEQIKNASDKKTIFAGKEMDSFLDSYIDQYSFFESIQIINENGKVINIAPFRRDLWGLDYSDDYAFRNAKQNKIYWSSVFISLNTGEPTLTLSIPFNKGALLGNLSLKKLTQLLEKNNLGNDIIAGIIDSKGMYVAHSDTNKVHQREYEPLNKFIMEQISKGESFSIITHKNETYIISYSTIKTTGWNIIIYQKEEVALRSVKNIIDVSIGGLILSLIFILIISVAGYKSIINPILTFTETTKRIADGNYSELFPVHSYSEINSLADSMNKMGVAIKSREEELLTRQKNLKQASKLANLGYWIWNKEGEKIKFSAEAALILSIDQTEISADEFAKNIVDEERRLFLSALEESINHGKPFDLIYRYKKTDNSIAYFFSQAELVSDSDGKIISMIGIIQDITSQKLNELKLEELLYKEAESNRLKTSLLANINHELRTPMNGIIGLTSILKEKLNDNEISDKLNSILNSSKRLMATLSSIIEISELESNKYLVKKTAFNILYETKQYLSEYEKIAAEKNLYLEFVTKNKDLTVNTDIILYRKIVINTIENAIKYTEQGGIKVIFDDGVPGITKISIADTGIGIEEKNFGLIFEEFRQVSEGYSRDFEGSGLGLSLVRKMTNLIDGEISVKSTIGTGSTFTLSIPSTDQIVAHPDSGKVKLKEKVLEEIVCKDIKQKVLLVEDNAINKQVVFNYLKGEYDLSHCFNGEKAIKLVKEVKFDLFLMDINLGSGLNGVETLAEIRKMKEYISTPAIAITGYALSSDENKFLNEGFKGYLPKPFDKEELLNIISSVEVI